MKKYKEPQIDILYMGNADIIMYSNSKDNDIPDGDWFGDLGGGTL